MNNTIQLKKGAGFTLLEVMVALAILALALAAGIKAASSNISNASYLQQRTLAHWVAMNKLAEFEVFDKWPTPGSTQRGSTLLAGQEWFWSVESTKSTQLEKYTLGVVTVKVRSADDDKQFLETLIEAYLI